MFKNRCLILTVLVMLCSFNLYSQNKLVISTIENAPPAATVIPVLTEAYKRIGIDVEFKSYPAMRAIENSNHGITDGEGFRVADIEKEYPNLIRINIPVRVDNMYIYIKKGREFEVDGWNSIPRGYILGYKRGIKFIQYAVDQYKLESKTTSNMDQLMQSLDADRNDLVIAGVKEAENSLNTLNLTNIVKLETPIHSVKLYHYLNVKHKGVAEKLEKVLMEMESSGEMERIAEAALN